MLQNFQQHFILFLKKLKIKLYRRLIDDVPRLCVGPKSLVDKNSIPCVVCGSRVMHTVLDLQNQPLANDFRTDKLKNQKTVKDFHFVSYDVLYVIIHNYEQLLIENIFLVIIYIKVVQVKV